MKNVTVKKGVVELADVNVVMSRAKDLTARFEHFENVTLKAAHAELYTILADIQSLYLSVISKGFLDETINKMKIRLQNRNVKVQKNMTDISVFVRCVLKCDRKKAFKYTRVIDVAIEQGIEPEALSKFIVENKGIESIVKASTESASSTKIKTETEFDNMFEIEVANVNSELPTQEPIATISRPASVSLRDASEYAFVLARVNSKNIELIEVLTEVPESMQKSAVDIIAQKRLDQRKADQVIQAEVDDDAERQELVDSIS